jgi:hypothetical protein
MSFTLKSVPEEKIVALTLDYRLAIHFASQRSVGALCHCYSSAGNDAAWRLAA